MRFEIITYINDEKFDDVLFTSHNSLFCWFFFETFDAYELIGKNSERTYSYEDLLTCRSRLLYYFEEDLKDLIRYVDIFKRDYLSNLKEEEDNEEYAYASFEREDIVNDLEVGISVGYILKFIDTLIEKDSDIKINFRSI